MIEKRFTRDYVGRILKANEGFEFETSYNSRNSTNFYKYYVKEGKLYIQESGHGSWSDSHYSNLRECTIQETQRFLRDHGKNLIVLI